MAAVKGNQHRWPQGGGGSWRMARASPNGINIRSFRDIPPDGTYQVVCEEKPKRRRRKHRKRKRKEHGKPHVPKGQKKEKKKAKDDYESGYIYEEEVSRRKESTKERYGDDAEYGEFEEEEVSKQKESTKELQDDSEEYEFEEEEIETSFDKRLMITVNGLKYFPSSIEGPLTEEQMEYIEEMVHIFYGKVYKIWTDEPTTEGASTEPPDESTTETRTGDVADVSDPDEQ